jgi:thioredoxin-dependent peroxiredoxin
MIAVGDVPADFTLSDHQDRPVAWSSLRGRPVVVFFYPRADTPGCTTEACAFRDLNAELSAAGATVIGMSGDTVPKQAAFAEKYGLTYPLLADPERAVLTPWGVYGQKMMYGKPVMGIIRTTVLFDAAGRVVHVWSPVKVDGHADQVLARVRQLAAG